MARLWLDDVRNPIAYGWLGATWVKTVEEAKKELLTGIYDHVSLDHDLGACDQCMRDADCEDPEEWLIKHYGMAMPNCTHIGTGYDLVCWMEENNIWPPNKVRVHSANPVGRSRMEQVIAKHYGT